MSSLNFINNELTKILLQKITACNTENFNVCFSSLKNDSVLSSNAIKELKQKFLNNYYLSDIYKNNNKENKNLINIINNIFENIDLVSIFTEISTKIIDAQKTNTVELTIKDSITKINQNNTNLQNAINSFEQQLNSNTVIVIIIFVSLGAFLLFLYYLVNKNKNNKINPTR